MAEDSGNSIWEIILRRVRLSIFLALVILASPFLVIGSYKNGVIERSMGSGADCLNRGSFIDAGKKYEEAVNQFGFFYDGYVLALKLFGGKYYKKEVVVTLRGLARTGAIAERLSTMDLDVVDAIKVARNDLTLARGLPDEAGEMCKAMRAELDGLESMLPLLKMCKDGNHKGAFLGFTEHVKQGKKMNGEFLGLATCQLLYECALNLKDAAIIDLAKKAISFHSRSFKNRFYQNISYKVDALTAQPPTPKAATPVGGKAPILKDRFATAMALARKKDFKKALPIFEECYTGDPKNENFVFYFALAQSKCGNADKAKTLSKEVLALNPAHKGATKLLQE